MASNSTMVAPAVFRRTGSGLGSSKRRADGRRRSSLSSQPNAFVRTGSGLSSLFPNPHECVSNSPPPSLHRTGSNLSAAPPVLKRVGSNLSITTQDIGAILAGMPSPEASKEVQVQPEMIHPLVRKSSGLSVPNTLVRKSSGLSVGSLGLSISLSQCQDIGTSDHHQDIGTSDHHAGRDVSACGHDGMAEVSGDVLQQCWESTVGLPVLQADVAPHEHLLAAVQAGGGQQAMADRYCRALQGHVLEGHAPPTTVNQGMSGMQPMSACPPESNPVAAMADAHRHIPGPYGPYNPHPMAVIAAQRAAAQAKRQARIEAATPYWLTGQIDDMDVVEGADSAMDPWEKKNVVMIKGKYRGRRAYVQRRVNKKYRVQVEGVAWGLEFYPNMFELA